MDEQWLIWSRQLLAIAQNGLAFSREPFDRERFEQIGRIGHDIMAAHAGFDSEVLKRCYPIEQGYATPKVDVRAGVFRDDRILLVQEKSDGLWALPGGWADVNEAPREAVEKEVLQESGFTAKAVKLAAVYDRRLHPHRPSLFHNYKIFFVCELTGGQAAASIETDAAEFFAEDALPALSTMRVTDGQVRMLFRHHRQPSLPAEFD